MVSEASEAQTRASGKESRCSDPVAWFQRLSEAQTVIRATVVGLEHVSEARSKSLKLAEVKS